jgi:exodeoxyribonuclease V alpha subunit
MYEGHLGVNNLNQELRNVLNGECLKKPIFIKSGETGLYEGDRVMVIKNDYDRNIFNGDVGKILRINIKDDEVEVKVFDWFDADSNGQKYVDKIMTFTLEEARTYLKVAYACTTHKVQGQEFDYIIMPMTSQFGVMLYKNLVYTAITRAKKKVFVFGSPSAFISATKNDREINRNSMLSLLIHENYQLECTEQVMSS